MRMFGRVGKQLGRAVEQKREAALQSARDVRPGPLPRAPFRERPNPRKVVAIGELLQQQIGERRRRLADGESRMTAALDQRDAPASLAEREGRQVPPRIRTPRWRCRRRRSGAATASSAVRGFRSARRRRAAGRVARGSSPAAGIAARRGSVDNRRTSRDSRDPRRHVRPFRRLARARAPGCARGRRVAAEETSRRRPGRSSRRSPSGSG